MYIKLFSIVTLCVSTVSCSMQLTKAIDPSTHLSHAILCHDLATTQSILRTNPSIDTAKHVQETAALIKESQQARNFLITPIFLSAGLVVLTGLKALSISAPEETDLWNNRIIEPLYALGIFAGMLKIRDIQKKRIDTLEDIKNFLQQHKNQTH